MVADMSTGSPDARGLVAPEARRALDALRVAAPKIAMFIGAVEGLAVNSEKWEAALTGAGIPVNEARPHAFALAENLPVVEAETERLAAEVERLRGALEELLGVAERTRGGDPTLNPEEWYAIRDYCRVLLAGDTGEAGT